MGTSGVREKYVNGTSFVFQIRRGYMSGPLGIRTPGYTQGPLKIRCAYGHYTHRSSSWATPWMRYIRVHVQGTQMVCSTYPQRSTWTPQKIRAWYTFCLVHARYMKGRCQVQRCYAGIFHVPFAQAWWIDRWTWTIWTWTICIRWHGTIQCGKGQSFKHDVYINDDVCKQRLPEKCRWEPVPNTRSPRTPRR